MILQGIYFVRIVTSTKPLGITSVNPDTIFIFSLSKKSGFFTPILVILTWLFHRGIGSTIICSLAVCLGILAHYLIAIRTLLSLSLAFSQVYYCPNWRLPPPGRSNIERTYLELYVSVTSFLYALGIHNYVLILFFSVHVQSASKCLLQGKSFLAVQLFWIFFPMAH